MLPLDYHIHSLFSCDCNESMEAMARAAITSGIRQIGFSDHFDPIPLDKCHDYFKPQAWWDAYHDCCTLFADSLTIQAGIEIGETHRFPDETRKMLQVYPWDYVLGSLHWVGDAVVFGSNYFECTPDEAYKRYFTELLQMVRQGDFDILAHMDVVKRYGFDNYGQFHPDEYEEEIRAVLRAAAKRGLAIEINTSTLRRSVGQTSPAPLILEWFREEGGENITLGSDAHHAEHVGYGLHHAIESVLKAGFNHLTGFKRRQAYVIEIESASPS